MPQHGRNPGKNRKNGWHKCQARRAKVSALYLAGRSMRSISEELGCSLGTIHNDVSRLNVQFQEDARVDFATRQGEMVAKFRTHYRMALAEFERSKEPRGKDKTPRVGDSRLLAAMQRALENEAKIWGVLKPGSVNVANTNVVNLDWDSWFEQVPEALDAQGRDLYQREIDKARDYQAPALPAPAAQTAEYQTVEALQARARDLEAKLAQRNGTNGNGAIGGPHDD
jgi:hypothetical protein